MELVRSYLCRMVDWMVAEEKNSSYDEIEQCQQVFVDYGNELLLRYPPATNNTLVFRDEFMLAEGIDYHVDTERGVIYITNPIPNDNILVRYEGRISQKRSMGMGEIRWN